MLCQDNAKGIGFLAGGASRRPHTDHAVGGFSGKELWKDLLIDGTESLGVAKEVGDPDQHIAKEGFHFCRGLLQIPDIFVDCFDLVNGHAAFDTAIDGVRLVLAEVVAGMGSQQDKYLLQSIFGFRRLFGDRPSRLNESVSCIGDKLGGHLGRRKLIIHQAGSKSAAGHAVVFG